jgi:hypothetical protein
MALADFENLDPEEADSYSGNTGHRAAKEEQYQQGHDRIIDWEHSRCLDKHPIHWLEDVDAISCQYIGKARMGSSLTCRECNRSAVCKLNSLLCRYL